MKKIMIVEDDEVVRRELEELLQNAGYQPILLKDFMNSKTEILSVNPDLVLLDINIPGLNGEMLLHELRKDSQVPVIMVTSKTSELDEVLSMSYGADDYITKPYNPTLLLLRIGAIMKRVGNMGAVQMQTYRDLKVNSAKGILARGEEELFLTKNEMIIFMHLLDHQNTIVSRDDLMTDLWDNDEFVNDNTLTVNISRLRAKLADFGYEDAIETRKKQGYILV
ncbi:MAG: response regulator transcription factor [Lachnospiraceae bacterium]|nr:response regulator transcription factor [Lachnospiraceae bacterium]